METENQVGSFSKRAPKVVVKVREKYAKKTPKKVKKVFHHLKWLETLTFILGLSFLLFPIFYQVQLGILLLIPIVGLCLNGLDKPSVETLWSLDHKGEHNFADFIDVASFFILFRVYLDFKLESYLGTILPSMIIFAAVWVILLLTHRLVDKSDETRWQIHIIIVLNIFLYSFTATTAINCTYDNSTPSLYEAHILEKRYQNLRKTRKRYSITISEWGHHKETERIYISKEKFNQLEEGDTILMGTKEGLLNIPWYFLAVMNQKRVKEFQKTLVER